MARIIVRITWKTLKWLLLLLMLLIVLGCAVGFYLLATDSGYRRIPLLINRLTPYHISYDSLEGNLLHRQRWENLLIEGPGLRFQTAQLKMNCIGAALWQRQVHCTDLSVEQAELHLPAHREKRKPASGGIPESLPQLRLPFRVDIDRFLVQGFTIYRQQKQLAMVSKSIVSAHLNRSDLDVSANITLSRLNKQEKINTYSAKLDGHLTLSGDYPLKLEVKSDSLLADKIAQTATLQIDGSLLAPQATLHADGWLQGDLSLTARVSPGTRMIDGVLLWREVALDDKQLVSPAGKAQLRGRFDALLATVQTTVSGTRIPEAQIVAKAQFGDHRLDQGVVTLHTRDGEITLNGNADFTKEPRFQGELAIRNFDFSSYNAALDAQLNGAFVINGQARDDDVAVHTVIRSLSGHWRGRPITGSGALEYRDKSLDLDKLHLDLAGNTLTADGSLSAHSDLKAVLSAPALAQLVPGLSGAVNGRITVTGAIKNPVLDAGVHWKDVQIVRNGLKDVRFASRKGTLTARGDLNALRLNLDAQASGENVAETKITGSTIVSRTEARALNLNLNNPDGVVQVRGEANYDKQLRWRVHGELRDVKVAQLLPSLQGQVNAELNSSGTIDTDGTLDALFEIPTLSGSWSGQALDGELYARLEGNSLSLKTLDFAVGKNTIKLTGKRANDELAFDLALNAPRLAVFHPALNGVLRGTARITGTAEAPEIQAALEGSDLGFRDNTIERLSLKLENALKRGGVFTNKLVASGIYVAGRHWSTIALDSSGRFDDHAVTMTGKGNGYTLILAARGGATDLRHWQGGIDTLTLRGSGLDWSLGKPVAVILSPETVSFDDLCLSDRYSAFCLNLKQQRQTTLSYRIDALDPRSFAPFIPSDLELTSQLKGTGELSLDTHGEINGTADLALTPGRLTITSANQKPVILTVAAASWHSRFSKQQGTGVFNIRFADAGRIAVRIQLSDFRKPKLRGTLNVQVPDIGKFRYFVPRVSELQGRIDGKLAFSGPVGQIQVSGDLSLDDGKVTIPEYASELKDIHLHLTAQDSGAIGIDGRIATAQGAMDLSGLVNLQPLTLQLHLNGKNMLLANAQKIRVLATPDITIHIDPENGIVINGEVFIPEATIDIPDTRSAQHLSDDVVISGRSNKTRHRASGTEPPLKAEITVKLGDKVFFRNANIDLRLIGGIVVSMAPQEPASGEGRIGVASGVYELYGQELEIKRGWATFSGAIDRPVIDVIALREVESVQAGVRVTGTPKNLRLELTSKPTLPDSTILSYLLSGRPPDATTDSTAMLQMVAAIGSKGFFPNDLAQKTGLDVFDIGIGGLKAGKYLLRDLYVGMQSNFFTGISRFLARYRLTRRLSLEASAQAEESVFDLLYEFETN